MSDLRILDRPHLEDMRMLLGFSGWMDGGDVSTGTVGHLVGALRARKLAEIDPKDFYIYNLPGSMETSAIVRPYTKIRNGLITAYEPPTNTFHVDEANRLILFEGKEPNLRWQEYADCIFSVAAAFDVRRIFFIGSVAGVVPHTRQPRLYSSVSSPEMKADLESYGVRFSNYEGPASIVTYLTTVAAQKALPMASLVAEIPAYIQGGNPICIEAMVRRVAAILDIQVDLEDLEGVSAVFEERLDKLVEEREELVALIRKLESDYDNEIFDTQMGDLKQWLEQQGIRLD